MSNEKAKNGGIAAALAQKGAQADLPVDPASIQPQPPRRRIKADEAAPIVPAPASDPANDDTGVPEFLAEEQPQQQSKSESLLDMISVDLNNIELTEKSVLRQQEDYDAIFTKKPVFGIAALQSAYSARMSALSLQEIYAIRDSASLDVHQQRLRLYQLLHSHVEDTSVGKLPDFKKWAALTSYGDYETFLYGAYCATFPENNEFDVTCQHCGEKSPLVVNNDTLIVVKDEDEVYTKERVSEILSAVDPAQLVSHSFVHKTERLQLPESKIIVDVHMPSLAEHLDMLKGVTPEMAQKYEASLGIILFVKGVFMPDLADLAAQAARVKAAISRGEASIGKIVPKYYPVADRNRQLQIVNKLSKNDGVHLVKAINGRINKYAITYGIKNAQCAKCGKDLGQLPINMEHALFTLVQRATED